MAKLIVWRFQVHYLWVLGQDIPSHSASSYCGGGLWGSTISREIIYTIVGKRYEAEVIERLCALSILYLASIEIDVSFEKYILNGTL